jgi:alpha-L-fucosidase
MIPASLTLAAPSPLQPYRSAKPLLQLQQEFLDLRFGMFVHFNMATFQNREWGDPKGPTSAFDPTHLDTDQWADAAVSAGMGYACITPKHHDGFCLWPTKTKSAGILQTPKKIDVFKRFVESFRKKGLKVGFHFSILDLRQDIRRFDVTPAKIQLIKDQLTELLTEYGPMDIVIFDGWDAPWSRISYTEVPFHEMYALVKNLQPNCLISELNASQYPPAGLYYSDIKAFEQNAGQHIPGDSSIPAQSCVTLTDGWFWKQGDEDRPLKTVHQVVEEWLKPQNEIHCNLILNAPPTTEGILAPNVVARLAEIGREWKNSGPTAKLDPSTVITTSNLATGQPIYAGSCADTVGPDEANDRNFDSAWTPDGGDKDGWLEIRFKKAVRFNTLALVEPVGMSDDYPTSRIERYTFELWDGSSWKTLASGESPHRVQFHTIASVSGSKLRLNLKGSQEYFKVTDIGVYDEPPRLAGD